MFILEQNLHTQTQLYKFTGTEQPSDWSQYSRLLKAQESSASNQIIALLCLSNS